MRRLREGSEGMVEKRLVCNLLVPFIGCPRGDKRRYEMLSVVASVCGFSEEERYKVGIGRRPSGGAGPISPSIVGGEVVDDGNVSFGDSWVSFLMNSVDADKEESS
jgi:hypothetical protein